MSNQIEICFCDITVSIHIFSVVSGWLSKMCFSHLIMQLENANPEVRKTLNQNRVDVPQWLDNCLFCTVSGCSFCQYAQCMFQHVKRFNAVNPSFRTFFLLHFVFCLVQHIVVSLQFLRVRLVIYLFNSSFISIAVTLFLIFWNKKCIVLWCTVTFRAQKPFPFQEHQTKLEKKTKQKMMSKTDRHDVRNPN